MIISKTNYRISILGGGNDTPNFYEQHGSYIIGFGLNRHVYVMANFIDKLDNICYEAFYTFSEKVSNISEFKNPGIYGSLTFLEQKVGKLPCLCIHVNNTLPSSCGIGSSSSLIVGILNAIYNLLGYKPNKQQLSLECNYIERELLCEPGGLQDPFWASYGNIGSLTIDKDGQIIYEKFNLSQDFISEFLNSSIIFYHSQRQSFNIANSYKNKKSEIYKMRLLELAKSGKYAFKTENLEEIKRLLRESWLEKKQISNLISTPELDKIFGILESNGGVGKVCGVGGGGAIYCLCSPSVKQKIIQEVSLPTIPVELDLEGSKIIYSS